MPRPGAPALPPLSMEQATALSRAGCLHCKRCAVAGVAMPATHLCPSAPPRYDPVALCADHAAPYKSKRKIPA